MVNLKMSSENGIESLVMNNVLVTDKIPVCGSNINVNEYEHLKDLHFTTTKHVDILIGQDYPSALVPLDVRRGPPGTPFATRTQFGWSVNGHSASNVSVVNHHVIGNFISTSLLEHKVNQLGD